MDPATNCQKGNEPLGSVKGKDFVDQLRNNLRIIFSSRSGQLQPTGGPHNTDLPECRTCGYMYQKFQGRIKLPRPLFTDIKLFEGEGSRRY